MSFLSKLIGGAAVEPITAVGNVITGIFGDKGEKLSHEQIMARLAQAPQIAQVELNKVEAGHRSVFISGWRPFIGWVCGFVVPRSRLGPQQSPYSSTAHLGAYVTS